MTTYIVCLVFIVLQIPLCKQNGEDTIKIRCFGKIFTIEQLFFFIDALLLIIVSSLRSQTVGTDSRAYFHWIQQLDFYSIVDLPRWAKESGIEIGYGFISKLILTLTGSKEIVLIAINTVLFCGIYAFCRKTNAVLGIFLFLAFSMFNQSMNINGQYVASVFLLMSIEAAHKREIKKYLILVILAFLFHNSAVIGLIFLPLVLFENKAVRNSIIIVVASFIASFFAPRVINAIVSRTFYSIYLYKEVASESGIGVAINGLIFLAYIVFYNQFRDKDEYAPVWIYATALTLSLNFYISELAIIGRMMIYFKMTYLVSIPSFISSFENKRVRIVIETLIVILFIVYYYHSINGSCFGTTPYISDILGIS